MYNTIKDMRVARGLTQEKLAQKAGISRPFLSFVETGTAKPSVTTAFALAKALDCTISDLFKTEEGPGTGLDEEAATNVFEVMRLGAGLSQSAAAERLGVTQGAISQWEQGLSRPKFDVIPAIAALYGCSIEQLFLTADLQKTQEN